MSDKTKPGTIILGGERYACTLLKIVERDGQGRPRSLTVLFDDESTTIKGGEHFLAAYIHAGSLAPQRERDDATRRAMEEAKDPLKRRGSS